MIGRLLCLAALAAGLLGAPILSGRANAENNVVVFAAASLGGVLEDVAKLSEIPVSFALAGSSTLARQIEAGAPANIYISANEAWMDDLAQQGFVLGDTRRTLLGNRLVLIGPLDTPRADPLTAQSLAETVGAARIAMALVDAVPAGIYGKEALQSMGLWAALAPQVVQSDNVRTALALVARGEAPFGIVYATDAALSSDVAVVGTFPEGTHRPIRYPAALVTDADTSSARAFFDVLLSAPAQDLFAQAGFQRPSGD